MQFSTYLSSTSQVGDRIADSASDEVPALS